MYLYYSGAEVGSWRNLLIEENIEHVSLSFMGLKRRVKHPLNWKLDEKFPEGQKIFVDSGAYTVNSNPEDYTEAELLEISAEYEAFLDINRDRIEMASEFDALALGEDFLTARRSDFYDDLGTKFMPIWHADSGVEELERLCSTYDRVGIHQSNIGDRSLAPTLNSLVARYAVKLHGIAATKPEIMREIRWDSVASTSWFSPAQYGDTIIWTQSRELKRYPKKYKDQSRRQHRTWFESNGFDYDKILADDSTEMLRISLWSWEQLVAEINRRHAFNISPVTNPQEWPSSEFEESTTEDVNNPTPEKRNSELLPATRKDREQKPMPVVGFDFQTTKIEGNDGEEIEQETPIMHMRSESMRMCDTCVLRDKCPGYESGANCLYNIPIQVETVEQMRALQNSLISMQTQRVLFMKMSEDLEGGYADPNLSSEIDRLGKLIKAKQEAEQEGFTFTVTAKEQGKTGMISRIFGQDAGSKLGELESPQQADKLIAEAGIVDAEWTE